MAEKKEEKPKTATDDKSAQATITDYLQAPRKNRKNYVIMALGPSFSRDLAGDLENFARKAFQNISVSMPNNTAELSRQFGRKISLLLISDEFDDLDKVIDLVKALKERRQSEKIPVLFLTRNARPLIEKYHENLLPYHETDDFLQYPGMARQRIYSAIKNGIENRNSRKTKRYRFTQNVTFFHLSRGEEMEAELLDINVHGALIKAPGSLLFKIGDQLMIKILASDYVGLENGDFIKLPCRIRRVFISGNMGAVSFENISEYKLRTLTKLVTAIVNHNLERKGPRV